MKENLTSKTGHYHVAKTGHYHVAGTIGVTIGVTSSHHVIHLKKNLFHKFMENIVRRSD
jgi:hypothetical protein